MQQEPFRMSHIFYIRMKGSLLSAVLAVQSLPTFLEWMELWVAINITVIRDYPTLANPLTIRDYWLYWKLTNLQQPCHSQQLGPGTNHQDTSHSHCDWLEWMLLRMNDRPVWLEIIPLFDQMEIQTNNYRKRLHLTRTSVNLEVRPGVQTKSNPQVNFSSLS